MKDQDFFGSHCSQANELSVASTTSSRLDLPRFRDMGTLQDGHTGHGLYIPGPCPSCPRKHRSLRLGGFGGFKIRHSARLAGEHLDARILTLASLHILPAVGTEMLCLRHGRDRESEPNHCGHLSVCPCGTRPFLGQDKRCTCRVPYYLEPFRAT
jgi:hypothetical protein